MSWGFGIDIYTNRNGNWTAKAQGLNADFLKSISGIRGSLDEEIPPVWNKDEILQAECHKTDTMEKAYQFTISKEDAAKVLKKVLGNEIDCNTEEEVKQYEQYRLDDATVLNDAVEHKNNTVAVYLIENVSRYDHNQGYFYNVDSFVSYRDKLLQKYKELLKSQFDFERLKSSLDYLKLSSEEKENVLSEFNYTEDDIQETEYKIDAVVGIINILNFYEQFDDEVIAYIYYE